MSNFCSIRAKPEERELRSWKIESAIFTRWYKSLPVFAAKL